MNRYLKHNFKELSVWQKSRALVKEMYQMTKKFPAEERFELVSQMKRSVISIASNIAEGSGRNSNKDFRRFLGMSLSSSYELETQLILSSDLGFINKGDLDCMSKQLVEIQKMLFGLRKRLEYSKVE